MDNRKVVLIPKKLKTKCLKSILSKFETNSINCNILYCDNIDNEKCDFVDLFKNFQWTIFNYSNNNIDKIDNNIFNICILNDYEQYYNKIPIFIERIQRAGLIILISNEITVQNRKIKYKLALFSRRLFYHLQSKTESCSVELNGENITPISLPLTLKTNVSDLNDFCIDIDQNHALNRLINTFVNEEQIRKSVTLLVGGSGRGKKTLMSLGIVEAVKHNIIDIFVMSIDKNTLIRFCDNLRRFLSVLNDADVHFRQCQHNFLLEIVRSGSITQKIRFLTFRDSFSKYDIGLLCIIEAAGLSSCVEMNKLLSYNPSVVWASVSDRGAHRGGEAVVQSVVVRPLRSFCGVAETLPGIVEEITVEGGVAIKEIVNKTDKKKFSSVTLSSPIIYNNSDSIESTINTIFCLNKPPMKLSSSTTIIPSPSDCQLVYIDKHVLFSGQPLSELLLAHIASIYSSFNSNNSMSQRDSSTLWLQLLADSPHHHLFILPQSLSPQADSTLAVPQILTLVHLTIIDNCVNIVNIVTNSKFQRLGYALRTLNCLHSYFSQSVNSNTNNNHIMLSESRQYDNINLDNDNICQLSNLLLNVNDIPPLPMAINYISCSFKASNELLTFWKKCNYLPVKVEPINVKEMCCTVIRDCRTVTIGNNTEERVDGVGYRELCAKIGNQLMVDLRQVDVTLAHEILFHKNKHNMTEFRDCNMSDITEKFDIRQLRKLDSFVQNIHSLDSVQELVHHIAVIYFSRRLPGVFLPKYQELTLVGFGLQLKSAKQLATEIILMERYQNTNIVDPFNLHKDIKKMIPLIVSHVRECVRVFLNHVTKIIEKKEDEEEEVPEKKRRLM